MQGYDLTPILKDPKSDVREFVIVEEDEELPMLQRGLDTNIRMRTLMTKTHKLTVRQGYPNYGELIDLKNDPLEVNNLWKDENSRELRLELTNKLIHEILNLQSRFPKKEALT